MFDSTTGSGEGIANSFFSVFGSVAEGLGQAAGKFASDFLPVWAGNQLNLRRVDQFDSSTFQQPTKPTVQQAAFDNNKFQFDASTILIAGAVVIAVIVVARS